MQALNAFQDAIVFEALAIHFSECIEKIAPRRGGEWPPTCSLRPVIPNNACPPRITAAAGTELAGTFHSACVII